MYSEDELNDLEAQRRRSGTPHAPLESFLERNAPLTLTRMLAYTAGFAVFVTCVQALAVHTDPDLAGAQGVCMAISLAMAALLWRIAAKGQVPDWLRWVTNAAFTVNIVAQVLLVVALDGATNTWLLGTGFAEVFLTVRAVLLLRSATLPADSEPS